MAAVWGPGSLQRCVVSPAGRHSASLIFLHGSGDSGQGLRRWIKQVLNQDLSFQHIKVIYPTAPPRTFLQSHFCGLYMKLHHPILGVLLTWRPNSKSRWL